MPSTTETEPAFVTAVEATLKTAPADVRVTRIEDWLEILPLAVVTRAKG